MGPGSGRFAAAVHIIVTGRSGCSGRSSHSAVLDAGLLYKYIYLPLCLSKAVIHRRGYIKPSISFQRDMFMEL